MNEETMRDILRLALVQKAIFCPVTGAVLDIDTAKFLVDNDGDPAYVLSPEAYGALSLTANVIAALAAKGLHLP